MKRLYIGGVLLAITVLLGVLVLKAFSGIYEPMADTLEKAGEAALAGDWEQASALSRDAYRRWEKYRDLTAAFENQDPLDRMEDLFAGLQVYHRCGETAAFAAACRELSQLSRALAQSQSVCLWNIL